MESLIKNCQAFLESGFFGDPKCEKVKINTHSIFVVLYTLLIIFSYGKIWNMLAQGQVHFRKSTWTKNFQFILFAFCSVFGID